MASPRMDLEHLKMEPEAVFESPFEVVSHEGLSRKQKKEVLTAWERLVKARQKGKVISGAAADDFLHQILEAKKMVVAEMAHQPKTSSPENN